ncbi:GntR family transcriptional regulator [Actinoplanes awajinensis]|uniref:GntR family transcriptional regulator n=1 Tax=Actinoplanes awajinensis subsp. mycoplanecinus TaxID=135947 RepID=A0A117MKG9_9ACTN|nr:GntR family transcriptional regulator [Actinoplanes awajinensis]KUL22342.1 GntR family transcriptional regulator [Actinoplanes awajinensis subsp. mycoplanecinus]
MLWRIDPTSDEPLYAQLVVQAHLAAARGELTPGDRLPSARELAESLDLNVHTVLKAYQQLRDEGLIELRRGRGAVVAARDAADLSPVEQALTALVRVAREAKLSTETLTVLVKEAMNR